jgi:Flp pilus assembly protein TadB
LLTSLTRCAEGRASEVSQEFIQSHRRSARDELYRYWRQGQSGGRLTAVLLAGTPPGAVTGPVIRVEVLPGARVFCFVVAAILMPLGTWLALTLLALFRCLR